MREIEQFNFLMMAWCNNHVTVTTKDYFLWRSK